MFNRVHTLRFKGQKWLYNEKILSFQSTCITMKKRLIRWVIEEMWLWRIPSKTNFSLFSFILIVENSIFHSDDFKFIESMMVLRLIFIIGISGIWWKFPSWNENKTKDKLRVLLSVFFLIPFRLMSKILTVCHCANNNRASFFFVFWFCDKKWDFVDFYYKNKFYRLLFLLSFLVVLSHKISAILSNWPREKIQKILMWNEIIVYLSFLISYL